MELERIKPANRTSRNYNAAEKAIALNLQLPVSEIVKLKLLPDRSEQSIYNFRGGHNRQHIPGTNKSVRKKPEITNLPAVIPTPEVKIVQKPNSVVLILDGVKVVIDKTISYIGITKEALVVNR